MRDYAMVSPKFWTGRTGKQLKAAGQEAVIVGMYLMTSPHANMIGLYHCPIAYIAIDTGLTIEGASKGLQSAIDAGFCTYDDPTEQVFVHEFAAYQIGQALSAGDKRCAGVRNEVSKTPRSQCLRGFWARYQDAFHLGEPPEFASTSEGPPKPLPSQEQEQEQEQEQKEERTSLARPKPAKSPACPQDQIVDLYHDKLPELPRVKLVTKDRVTALQRRWAWVLSSTKPDGSRRATTSAEALAWFGEYFGRASANDFLMGRTARGAGHEHWKCDLDFLLTDRGLKQVIEKTEVPA